MDNGSNEGTILSDKFKSIGYIQSTPKIKEELETNDHKKAPKRLEMNESISSLLDRNKNDNSDDSKKMILSKRRGRSLNNKSLEEESLFNETSVLENSLNSDVNINDLEMNEIKPKRRGRPPKIKIKPIEEINKSFSESESLPVKRSRRPKSFPDYTFDSVLNESTSSQALDLSLNEKPSRKSKKNQLLCIREENTTASTSNELNNTTLPSSSSVHLKKRKRREDTEDQLTIIECAKCNEQMSKDQFSNHNLQKHYLLSWCLGMTANDLLNEHNVIALLIKAHKSLGNEFICEKCSSKLDSSLEFWAHLKSCDDWFKEEISKMIAREMAPKSKGRPKLNKFISTELEKPDPTMNNSIKCLKCQEEMLKKYFNFHNLYRHYLLGWYEGLEPIEISKESKVCSLLLKALKLGIEEFICETCGTVKKSAVGFWSHLCICFKSEEEQIAFKVECQICGRMLMPASMKTHMKLTHAESDNVETEKGFRKAATMAKTKLQEFINSDSMAGEHSPKKSLRWMYTQRSEMTPRVITSWTNQLLRDESIVCKNDNCTFSCKNIDEMIYHFNSCGHRKEDKFECKFCKKSYGYKNDILSHLKVEHFDLLQNNTDEYKEEDAPEDNDETKNEISSVPVRLNKNFQFITFEKFLTPFNYTLATKWTLNFHYKNYQNLLFEAWLKQDYSLIPSEFHDKYLPETRKSIHFARLIMKESIIDRTQIEFNWRTLNLFEGHLEDNVPMFFAGGPVWAMAWCPLPVKILSQDSDKTDQFLAVAVYPSMDTSTPIHPVVSFPGLIQIWNTGPLFYLEAIRAPKLAFALAHEYGLVHAFAWCPSGAFQPPDRLGLLAAACSNGFIHIFSIPFKTENSPTLYSAKPVKTLQSDVEITDAQCLCVSWYRGKGHDLIAAGFSNGMVAVWRLTLTSKLFQNSPNLLPIIYFSAHIRAVNSIDFVLHKEGCYLMTCSHDCTLNFWNLENVQGPIWSSKLRGFPTSAIWLSHWFSAACTFDQAYNLSLSNTALIAPRSFGFPPVSIICHNSVCWSSSFNDWLNAIVQCTLAGELMILFPKHLVVFDNDRLMKKSRFLLGYSEIIRIDGKDDNLFLDHPTMNVNESPENKPEGRPATYEELKKSNRGLLINDFSFDNFKKLPPESLKWLRNFEELRKVPPDLFPLTSINRVSWNPNMNSYYWMAEGRQCGLVRLICISGAGVSHVTKKCQDASFNEYFS